MPENSLLSLDRLFDSKEFDSKPFGPARWLAEDAGYTTLEPAAGDEKVKELIRYDLQSGSRSVLVGLDMLHVETEENPLVIKDYEWSPDKKHLLFLTNSQRVWREHTRGDYWLLQVENGRLSKLGGEAKPATLMFAKISPDSQSVAYLCENNIYTENISSGAITQLTLDGAEKIINGTSDWVYEEEFRLRDGFKWSPDSKNIAYWQFNTEGIETFTMINNTDGLYPKLIEIPYPKAGTVNSACRVGVVSAQGGETTWMDVPGASRDHYIPKMEWAANSEQIILQQLNRLQNRNLVMLGSVSDGSTKTVVVEEDESWIDLHDDLKWLDDGAAFTWVSDRDGWQHIFTISRDGNELTLLTPGEFDVISVLHVDEQSGWVYFIASPDNPAQRYLFRTALSGDGRLTRLTPLDMPGTHSYQISKTAAYAFHTYSRIDKPPVVSLISLPDHQTIRVLENNEELANSFNALDRQAYEFFRFDQGDGTLLDGWCLKPPDFNPEQQYPTLFYVYGEPAGQTVLDNWGPKSRLWHNMLAQQGYVIISIDNQGTPAPRGRDWRKSVYRQVGIMTTASQAAGAKVVIEARPYIDPRRVGVWGWSGGGSMTLNLMFKHPKIYKTGIAVAAVSNMHYYDTVYQERYMGLPEDNEKGYNDGSPINFASQLEGRLMIIHGTADDNVHYQCHEALVNELITHNKQFSMMAYPNRTHSIKEGKNTSRHLYTLMTNFLEENLKNLE
jgi:dipeptidyl-peptidase 4